MNFLRQDFRKYRLTGTQTDRQVTCGHFRSRDKDGGHTIRSFITENTKLHPNLVTLFFIEPKLWVIEVYIARIGVFDVFGSCNFDLDPMTFIYELDSYCLEICRICKYELRTSRLLKVIV